MKVAENRKHLKRHIKQQISRNGVAILSVTPNTPFSTINYSYTVGLSLKGLPELFICGPIPNEVMGAILKNQAQAWIKEGKPSIEVRKDIVRSSIPDAPAMRSKTRILDAASAIQDYCVELRQRAPKGAQVYQILFPDMENRLPGERDYDTRYHQDLIAVNHIDYPVEPLVEMTHAELMEQARQYNPQQFASESPVVM